MPEDPVLEVLSEAAAAVASSLATLDDWDLTGATAGQHRSDLVADAAARRVLEGAGFGVLSEESGEHATHREIVVVVDPLDGSTNAARGIPWFATSLCALDAAGPRASLVVNLASGTRFEAVRGAGARRDGRPLRPSGCESLQDAIVGLSGYPPQALGWRQYRALGAAALDMCLVAAGALDGYVDCSEDAHGAWDYLGALLVCTEAGAPVADAFGRELVTHAHAVRRTPLVAATPALLAELCSARRTFGAPPEFG